LKALRGDFPADFITFPGGSGAGCGLRSTRLFAGRGKTFSLSGSAIFTGCKVTLNAGMAIGSDDLAENNSSPECKERERAKPMMAAVRFTANPHIGCAMERRVAKYLFLRLVF